ncbi:hypothetical protein UC35_00535 [Ramlibacter tataouinensis]|uniref:Uncharacterized protein n=1 Tax=Ramlibacter tataouinensis TaxID=94132 RepID=A0A127JNQ8_9BURK|nr:hypothetical protein UC35_00535 [Ramlibacter tataouinensis]
MVNAVCQSNIGCIVQVVGPYQGEGDWAVNEPGVVWLVKSSKRMTWIMGDKRYRRTQGPARDDQLQPIRGQSPSGDAVGREQLDRVTTA